MENIIDIENVEKSIQKLNLYINEETENNKLLLSKFTNINTNLQIPSSKIMNTKGNEIIKKYNIINSVHKNNNIILSKNVEKYRHTATIVTNTFDKL